MDFEAVTERQQQVWSTGDYATIAVATIIVGELLCEAVDLHPSERVLDVAAGSGNVALAAARRWCAVTATDYVPELLGSARRRAACEGLTLELEVADAQDLPFDDGSFDVVLSSFGAMFAPDQARAADELLRVCRPGGRIGMANWTPDGMVGEWFRATAVHVAPSPGLRSPAEWGTEARLRELFGDRIRSLRCETRQFVFRHPSPEHMLEYYRTWFGPTRVAFESLDEGGQHKLGQDVLNVFRRHNRSGDETLVAPSDYLEVVAVKV